jgi:hypothetical protein
MCPFRKAIRAGQGERRALPSSSPWGVDLSKISTCLNTLTPTWRGNEEHLTELDGEGDLKRVAEPPAKRAKQQAALDEVCPGQCYLRAPNWRL